MSSTTNEMWLTKLYQIYELCNTTTARGFRFREKLNSSSSVYMTSPLVNLKARRLGFRFMCAEAAYILNGGNRVRQLKPYSKIIDSFSDEGLFFHGAYGPKVIDQLDYIIKAFKADLNTRRAVLNIWREKPYLSNDIPCTLSAQFIIRDNLLHCIDTMRSSDMWLGVPYDWFTFSMISAYICICLRYLGIAKTITPGILYMNVGSQHVYENSFGMTEEKIRKALSSNPNDELFEYEPLDVSEFIHPDDFVNHLQKIADLKTSSYKWLQEVYGYYKKD